MDCWRRRSGLNSPSLFTRAGECSFTGTLGMNVTVSYLELTRPPTPPDERPCAASIAAEKLCSDEYLSLYTRVGESVRWDQRLRMPRAELAEFLGSTRSQIYVLRDALAQPIGLCEFERALPDIELKNFGLVPSAQGKGLGSFLLRTALQREWQLQPRRIWLHTDSWDHPAAIKLYQSAGFQVYLTREEPPGEL